MIAAPKAISLAPPACAAGRYGMPRDPIAPAEHLQAAHWEGGCEDSQSSKGVVVGQKGGPHNGSHSVQHDIIAGASCIF